VAPPVNGLSGFVNAMEIAEGGTTRDALATNVSPRDSGMLTLLPVGTIRSFRRTLKRETVQSVSFESWFPLQLEFGSTSRMRCSFPRSSTHWQAEPHSKTDDARKIEFQTPLAPHHFKEGLAWQEPTPSPSAVLR
jgi:hypothetical protein